MSADKTPAPEKLPVPQTEKAPAPKPPKPIDQTEFGRVRKPHGGASKE